MMDGMHRRGPGGLLGGLQQGVGGLLGGVNDWRQQNPGALTALGVGMMRGDLASGFEQAAQLRAGRTEQQRMEAMKREAWEREDEHRAQTFGLQQDKFDFARQQAAQDQQLQAQVGQTTAKVLEAQGAPPELVEMARIGRGGDAWKMWSQIQGGADTDQYGFPSSGAISQKIKAYEMQGLDRDTAVGLASGRYQVSLDPNTGERVIVDVATQSIVPLQRPDSQQQAQADPMQGGQQGSGGTLMDMVDQATGVGSAAKQWSTDTLGQIPGPVGDALSSPDTARAVQTFELFKRNLIQSMSLNPRFPVAEQKRIESLVPRGAFTSPDTLRASLETLDQELSNIERTLTTSINDRNTPVDVRNEDARTLSAIREARRRIGTAGGQSGEERGGGAMAPGSETVIDGVKVRRVR